MISPYYAAIAASYLVVVTVAWRIFFPKLKPKEEDDWEMIKQRLLEEQKNMIWVTKSS